MLDASSSDGDASDASLPQPVRGTVPFSVGIARGRRQRPTTTTSARLQGELSDGTDDDLPELLLDANAALVAAISAAALLADHVPGVCPPPLTGSVVWLSIGRAVCETCSGNCPDRVRILPTLMPRLRGACRLRDAVCRADPDALVFLLGRVAGTARSSVARSAFDCAMVELLRDAALRTTGAPALGSGDHDAVVRCLRTLQQAGADLAAHVRPPRDATAGWCHIASAYGTTGTMIAVWVDSSAWVSGLFAVGAGTLELAHDACGKNFVHLACEHGRPRALAALLAAGGEYAATSARGWTPAHHAAAAPSDAAAADCVAQLVRAGADVRALADDGSTALHVAVRREHVQLMRLLVEHGCCVEAQNYASSTPLHIAAENGCGASIACLIELGASVDAACATGKCPLQLATDCGRDPNQLFGGVAHACAQPPSHAATGPTTTMRCKGCNVA